MMAADYWKHSYRHAWSQSSEREAMVAARIEQETTRTVVPVGLGATTTRFLSGTAASHGHQRGGADLRIDGTNILIEVTGTYWENVEISDPLWIRPDKLQFARRNDRRLRTWVVHWLERGSVLRVIPLNKMFFDRLDAHGFNMVYKTIRGVLETFIEIPANDPCVRPWECFIDWLNEV